MEVRIADASHIPIISKLAHTIWPVCYGDMLSQEQITYMLGLFYNDGALQKQMQAGHNFLLLYDDETPVGFASYNFIDNTTAKLQKLYVLPEVQGKGCGKILINQVMNACKEKANKLILNVNRNNKALTFYKHLGFEIMLSEDIDIGNGYFMNDYVMHINLKPE